jgi:hypothetical protein
MILIKCWQMWLLPMMLPLFESSFLIHFDDQKRTAWFNNAHILNLFVKIFYETWCVSQNIRYLTRNTSNSCFTRQNRSPRHHFDYIHMIIECIRIWELSAGSFSRCSSLSTLKFETPSRITHLLDLAFSHCHRLCFIEIPKSVRLIGRECFFRCYQLIEVVFESPATVQMIESGAFSSCGGLTSFTVPSSVSTLGDYLLAECTNLSSVTWDTPSRLTTIPHYAFKGCRILTTLTLPDFVTAIAASAFRRCSATSIISAYYTMSSCLAVQQGIALLGSHKCPRD